MSDRAVDELTPKERRNARDIFRGVKPGNVCVHCNGIHAVVPALTNRDRQPCPRVKSATFHLDGTLTSVEYWPNGWETPHNITYPHDVFQDEDEPTVTDNEADTE